MKRIEIFLPFHIHFQTILHFFQSYFLGIINRQFSNYKIRPYSILLSVIYTNAHLRIEISLFELTIFLLNNQFRNKLLLLRSQASGLDKNSGDIISYPLNPMGVEKVIAILQRKTVTVQKNGLVQGPQFSCHPFRYRSKNQPGNGFSPKDVTHFALQPTTTKTGDSLDFECNEINGKIICLRLNNLPHGSRHIVRHDDG